MKTLKYDDGGLSAIAYDAQEISIETFEAEGNGRVVVIGNDVDVLSLAGKLDSVEAIILEFPTFRDGRAYSQARRLRDQLQFKGDLIARGDVGRDQVLFMLRSGFNVFEADAAKAKGFEEAFGEFSAFYQPASDAAVPVWQLRARAAIAA